MKNFKTFIFEDKTKDIVVTIPKSEYKTDDRETETLKKGGCQFWKMNRLPSGISINSRLYFVKKGKVESSMRIFKIVKDAEEKCTTTNRVWKGCILYLDDLKPTENNIPSKGFQGFRYKWW